HDIAVETRWFHDGDLERHAEPGARDVWIAHRQGHAGTARADDRAAHAEEAERGGHHEQHEQRQQRTTEPGTYASRVRVGRDGDRVALSPTAIGSRHISARRITHRRAMAKRRARAGYPPELLSRL